MVVDKWLKTAGGAVTSVQPVDFAGIPSYTVPSFLSNLSITSATVLSLSSPRTVK